MLARRAQLEATAAAVAGLEARCVAVLTAAPTLAIPQVRALGEVPTEPAALAAYEAKLDAVSRALAQAHAAYAAAIAERDELIGLAGALDAQAAASAAITAQERADLTPLRAQLAQALGQEPLPLNRARALMAAYQTYLTAITATGRTT